MMNSPQTEKRGRIHTIRFMPEDIVRELQVSGITAVIHKATEVMDGEFLQEVSIPQHDLNPYLQVL